jgi:acetylornithine deacetylase/succinyl-diaminopimelate desuccinylase-like protein
MCAAAARAADGGLGGEVIIAAVADEEFESLGTRALLESGVRADAAIVTEPTRLAIAPAHRGFAWIRVEVRGRAAHGSRYDIGVDAIRHAGLLLAELDVFEGEELARRTHPLLGHASLHASFIEGGIGISTYPDRCVLRLERRTLPGESAAHALEEVREACERVRARRTTFDAEATLEFAQGPSDVATDAPVAVRVRLRNSGPRRGREVVQLYASRPDSAIERPPRWLAGFAVTDADPDAEVTVEVALTARALAHWDEGARAFVVEPGTFELAAGRSSRDLRCATQVRAPDGAATGPILP